SQWPPGFPTLIAGPMALGTNAVTGARLVVAASAAVTVLLTMLLVGSTFGFIWGLVATATVALTASIVAVHLDALSEPPFIAVLVATLWLMISRPERPTAYGITAALALLLRYVGLGVVVACGVWAALQPATSRAVRVKRGVLAVLPGVIAWL